MPSKYYSNKSKQPMRVTDDQLREIINKKFIPLKKQDFQYVKFVTQCSNAFYYDYIDPFHQRQNINQKQLYKDKVYDLEQFRKFLFKIFNLFPDQLINKLLDQNNINPKNNINLKTNEFKKDKKDKNKKDQKIPQNEKITFNEKIPFSVINKIVDLKWNYQTYALVIFSNDQSQILTYIGKQKYYSRLECVGSRCKKDENPYQCLKRALMTKLNIDLQELKISLRDAQIKKLNVHVNKNDTCFIIKKLTKQEQIVLREELMKKAVRVQKTKEKQQQNILQTKNEQQSTQKLVKQEKYLSSKEESIQIIQEQMEQQQNKPLQLLSSSDQPSSQQSKPLYEWINVIQMFPIMNSNTTGISRTIIQQILLQKRLNKNDDDARRVIYPFCIQELKYDKLRSLGGLKILEIQQTLTQRQRNVSNHILKFINKLKYDERQSEDNKNTLIKQENQLIIDKVIIKILNRQIAKIDLQIMDLNRIQILDQESQSLLTKHNLIDQINNIQIIYKSFFKIIKKIYEVVNQKERKTIYITKEEKSKVQRIQKQNEQKGKEQTNINIEEKTQKLNQKEQTSKQKSKKVKQFKQLLLLEHQKIVPIFQSNNLSQFKRFILVLQIILQIKYYKLQKRIHIKSQRFIILTHLLKLFKNITSQPQQTQKIKFKTQSFKFKPQSLKQTQFFNKFLPQLQQIAFNRFTQYLNQFDSTQKAKIFSQTYYEIKSRRIKFKIIQQNLQLFSHNVLYPHQKRILSDINRIFNENKEDKYMNENIKYFYFCSHSRKAGIKFVFPFISQLINKDKYSKQQKQIKNQKSFKHISSRDKQIKLVYCGMQKQNLMKIAHFAYNNNISCAYFYMQKSYILVNDQPTNFIYYPKFTRILTFNQKQLIKNGRYPQIHDFKLILTDPFCLQQLLHTTQFSVDNLNIIRERQQISNQRYITYIKTCIRKSNFYELDNYVGYLEEYSSHKYQQFKLNKSNSILFIDCISEFVPNKAFSILQNIIVDQTPFITYFQLPYNVAATTDTFGQMKRILRMKNNIQINQINCQNQEILHEVTDCHKNNVYPHLNFIEGTNYLVQKNNQTFKYVLDHLNANSSLASCLTGSQNIKQQFDFITNQNIQKQILFSQKSEISKTLIDKFYSKENLIKKSENNKIYYNKNQINWITFLTQDAIKFSQGCLILTANPGGFVRQYLGQQINKLKLQQNFKQIYNKDQLSKKNYLRINTKQHFLEYSNYSTIYQSKNFEKQIQKQNSLSIQQKSLLRKMKNQPKKVFSKNISVFYDKDQLQKYPYFTLKCILLGIAIKTNRAQKSRQLKASKDQINQKIRINKLIDQNLLNIVVTDLNVGVFQRWQFKHVIVLDSYTDQIKNFHINFWQNLFGRTLNTGNFKDECQDAQNSQKVIHQHNRVLHTYLQGRSQDKYRQYMHLKLSLCNPFISFWNCLVQNRKNFPIFPLQRKQLTIKKENSQDYFQNKLIVDLNIKKGSIFQHLLNPQMFDSIGVDNSTISIKQFVCLIISKSSQNLRSSQLIQQPIKFQLQTKNLITKHIMDQMLVINQQKFYSQPEEFLMNSLNQTLKQKIIYNKIINKRLKQEQNINQSIINFELDKVWNQKHFNQSINQEILHDQLTLYDPQLKLFCILPDKQNKVIAYCYTVLNQIQYYQKQGLFDKKVQTMTFQSYFSDKMQENAFQDFIKKEFQHKINKQNPKMQQNQQIDILDITENNPNQISKQEYFNFEQMMQELQQKDTNITNSQISSIYDNPSFVIHIHDVQESNNQSSLRNEGEQNSMEGNSNFSNTLD